MNYIKFNETEITSSTSGMKLLRLGKMYHALSGQSILDVDGGSRVINMGGGADSCPISYQMNLSTGEIGYDGFGPRDAKRAIEYCLKEIESALNLFILAKKGSYSAESQPVIPIGRQITPDLYAVLTKDKNGHFGETIISTSGKLDFRGVQNWFPFIDKNGGEACSQLTFNSALSNKFARRFAMSLFICTNNHVFAYTKNGDVVNVDYSVPNHNLQNKALVSLLKKILRETKSAGEQRHIPEHPELKDALFYPVNGELYDMLYLNSLGYSPNTDKLILGFIPNHGEEDYVLDLNSLRKENYDLFIHAIPNICDDLSGFSEAIHELEENVSTLEKTLTILGDNQDVKNKLVEIRKELEDKVTETRDSLKPSISAEGILHNLDEIKDPELISRYIEMFFPLTLTLKSECTKQIPDFQEQIDLTGRCDGLITSPDGRTGIVQKVGEVLRFMDHELVDSHIIVNNVNSCRFNVDGRTYIPDDFDRCMTILQYGGGIWVKDSETDEHAYLAFSIEKKRLVVTRPFEDVKRDVERKKLEKRGKGEKNAVGQQQSQKKSGGPKIH